MRLGLTLPEHTEEFTVPAQQRLWLDKEKGLVPGPCHPGQNHQEKPVSLSVCRSLHLPTKDDQWHAYQHVFCQEFGFASGQIGEHSEHKGSRRGFNPSRNTFLERVKAETDTLFDERDDIQHERNLFFMKRGAWSEHPRRMDRVDCTRLSRAVARKLAPSFTFCSFSEQMSRVASTGMSAAFARVLGAR